MSRDGAYLAPLRQELADAGGKIVAVIAVYGRCAPNLEYPVITPLLILIGSNDDWTPAKPCHEFASEGSNPKLVQLHVYPGATHAFDEGKNVTYVGRWGESKRDRLPALAAELVDLKVEDGR